MPGMYLVATGLRLALGLTMAGSLWSAGRTGSLGQTLVTGALILVVLVLSQEAAQGLIDAATVGYRLRWYAATVLVAVAGSAGLAYGAGRVVGPVLTVSFGLGLVLLAASGQLTNPGFVQSLAEMRAITEAQDARTAGADESAAVERGA